MPKKPWEDIFINLIMGLPTSNNGVTKLADAILVIINYFMKIAKYFLV
jgi:hypothetical protein